MLSQAEISFISLTAIWFTSLARDDLGRLITTLGSDSRPKTWRAIASHHPRSSPTPSEFSHQTTLATVHRSARCSPASTCAAPLD